MLSHKIKTDVCNSKISINNNIEKYMTRNDSPIKQ
jgi:hypothetical protein